MSTKHLIVVVGAGPAGLSVANVMSKQGHEVVVLNRDIKFGGLAEYGIFPNKHKLRGGLRKGYWEVLTRPNVRYFGNVTVGNGYHLTVSELRALGPSALVFSTGAQGTKTIGVEGDTAKGVYHAKDSVYHYNLLPGFSTRPRRSWPRCGRSSRSASRRRASPACTSISCPPRSASSPTARTRSSAWRWKTRSSNSKARNPRRSG